ncbi:hypothetical protein KAI58_00105 [Candidatus Gracilibacteria bacterium]|nr:hypothetical protein [Candidatus Gracilibacteria bacterium]
MGNLEEKTSMQADTMQNDALEGVQIGIKVNLGNLEKEIINPALSPNIIKFKDKLKAFESKSITPKMVAEFVNKFLGDVLGCENIVALNQNQQMVVVKHFLTADLTNPLVVHKEMKSLDTSLAGKSKEQILAEIKKLEPAKEITSLDAEVQAPQILYYFENIIKESLRVNGGKIIDGEVLASNLTASWNTIRIAIENPFLQTKKKEVKEVEDSFAKSGVNVTEQKAGELLNKLTAKGKKIEVKDMTEMQKFVNALDMANEFELAMAEAQNVQKDPAKVKEIFDTLDVRVQARIAEYTAKLDGKTIEEIETTVKKNIQEKVDRYIEDIPDVYLDTQYATDYAVLLRSGKIDKSFTEYLNEDVQMTGFERLFLMLKGLFMKINNGLSSMFGENEETKKIEEKVKGQRDGLKEKARDPEEVYEQSLDDFLKKPEWKNININNFYQQRSSSTIDFRKAYFTFMESESGGVDEMDWFETNVLGDGVSDYMKLARTKGLQLQSLKTLEALDSRDDIMIEKNDTDGLVIEIKGGKETVEIDFKKKGVYKQIEDIKKNIN